MHITLRQLEIFKTVAQTGRVTAAAEQLFISQPAASMALSELEKHVGPLFDRHAGVTMTLNDIGRSLLPMAVELIDRAQEIETQFISEKLYDRGFLKIDASSTIGNNLMPAILDNLLTEFPNIRVDLEVGSVTSIQRKLLAMEIDIAAVEGSCLHPDIEVMPWRKDELVIICSPHHPLANGSADVEQLKHENWILREPGSGTREIFDEILVSRLGAPKVAMTFNRAEAVKQAVMEGIGISCISGLAVRREREVNLLSVIETPDLVLQRYFYLLLNKNRYRSGVVRKITDFLLGYGVDGSRPGTM